jgi:hypothetical protein
LRRWNTRAPRKIWERSIICNYAIFVEDMAKRGGEKIFFENGEK